LPNMIRFKQDDLSAADIAQAAVPQVQGSGGAKKKKPAANLQDVPMVSSARAPLQKFRWGDYTLDPGKRYRSRVVARCESATDIIATGKEAENRRQFDTIPGGVSVEVKTEDNHGHEVAVFFNRGAAASRAYNNRYGNN